jgi:hypothetical protein
MFFLLNTTITCTIGFLTQHSGTYPTGSLSGHPSTNSNILTSTNTNSFTSTTTTSFP